MRSITAVLVLASVVACNDETATPGGGASDLGATGTGPTAGSAGAPVVDAGAGAGGAVPTVGAGGTTMVGDLGGGGVGGLSSGGFHGGGFGGAAVGGLGGATVGGSAGAASTFVPGSRRSFDIDLNAVGQAGASYGMYPCPVPATQSPRLDVATDADGTKIALFAFGVSAAFPVVASGSKWTFGPFAASTSDYQGTASLTIPAITITLAADGTPTTLDGAGTENGADGDDEHCDSVTDVTGVIKADVTAPTVQLVTPPRLGPSGVLPWDPIVALASEPLDVTTFGAATSATLDGAALPAFTADGADPTTAWSGVRQLFLRAPWDSTRGHTIDAAIGAVTDPSGNAASAVAGTFAVLDPGLPLGSQGFDSGDFLAFGGSVPFTDTDHCVDGGCLDFGEVPTDCPLAAAGVALRVGATAATRLHARTEVVLAGDTYDGSPIVFELTSPSGATAALTPSDLAPIDAGSWVDFVVPLPSGWPTGDIGVVILPGAGERVAHCGGVVGPTPKPVHLIIDRVWVD